MEVARWKSNVKAVATFYRGSAPHYEEFEIICTEENLTAYRFSAYAEVRFAENLLNLSTAVYHICTSSGNQLLKAFRQQNSKKMVKNQWFH